MNSHHLAHDLLWQAIRDEAVLLTKDEPFLASFFYSTILNHDTLEAAVSFHLSNKLDSPTMPAMVIREIIQNALAADPAILDAIRCDIKAIKERDPVCRNLSTPFLYFKGFHALQAYRIAHWLWQHGRESLALFFQNQISVVFAVDIHPAALLGGALGIRAFAFGTGGLVFAVLGLVHFDHLGREIPHLLEPADGLVLAVHVERALGFFPTGIHRHVTEFRHNES